MKQHKLKVRLLSMLTALTMLTALLAPMTSYASLAQVKLYYTKGDAVTHNYNLDVQQFISKYYIYASDYKAGAATVDVKDNTICSVQSVRIEKDDNGKEWCKFSIVPRKAGETTITLSMTLTYVYTGETETRSQDIPILVQECPNHNVVQGKITDSYNARSCSACGFYEEKQHTYNENHICTVCNHQCTHSSVDWTKDENGHSKKCADCKAELQSYTAHTYTANDSRHTCSECGYSRAHTYDENHICTVCKHECTHSFKNTYQTSTGHYTVCTDCGYRTDTEAHTYKQKAGDKTYHYCSVCNYKQNHSFGAWQAVGDQKKRNCEICGYTDTGESEKRPHKENSTHNLCNDSECTIANHKLPTSGLNKSWSGINSTSNLNYSYGESPDTDYRLYNIIASGTTLTSVWEFPDYIMEKKLYNCLDGTRLTLSEGAYIHIHSGETYSLTDCRGGIGDVYGGTDGVIKIDKGGTFDFYEGTITGNSGDGIIVNNGTMNLYGGTIMNNTGAAIINKGTLNIYGGTITNNTGGGIIGTGTINFKNVSCSTGNPVIANNTIDGKTCNIKGASKISVTALGEEASVGFMPAETVTPGTPLEISANGGEYYSCFVSDSDDYAIIQNGNGIQLIAAHSVLEHHAAKAATCTEGGNDEYWSCVDCNRLYSDKDGNTEIYSVPETEATGHSLTHQEEKAATCTEAGNSEYWECTVCHKLFSDENGETEISEIPTIQATGHSLTKTEAQNATCTARGNREYWTCSGCHKYFSDANGTIETTLADTTIAAKGHTWGAWTVKTPASENAKGEEQRECSVCHVTETRDIPVLGHKHTMTAHAAQAATCTESGNLAYWTCSGCNKLFSDEAGTTETTLADTVIAAKGHTEVEIPAVAATCTKGGKTAGVKCSVCGTVLTAPTETVASGHSWGEWVITKPADETTDGEKSRECSRCNETETQVIPATGHTCNWGDWTITTAPTLTATGKAERVCKINAAHKESADLPVLTDTTVWTYEEITAPTQDTDGEGKYTSAYGEVKITLPATGTDKFSIRYEGGNAIVTAPTAGTYAVLFAAYDADGRLTSLSVQTVPIAKGETTVAPIDFTANGTVKVMLWESPASMKPLCGADEQVSSAE